MLSRWKRANVNGRARFDRRYTALSRGISRLPFNDRAETTATFQRRTIPWPKEILRLRFHEPDVQLIDRLPSFLIYLIYSRLNYEAFILDRSLCLASWFRVVSTLATRNRRRTRSLRYLG